LSDERLAEFLRRMWEIRAFEEATQRLFTSGLVRGSTHLCQGQEAVVVGACGALRDGDSMLCTYRGHGAVLAMGAPADRAFAEIIGKAGGLCGGKGGSMHLTDVSRGAMGSFAIVGGHLPIAVGAGLALDQTGQQNAVLCQFGEGATNTGAFHEALNLAGVWNLPVVFQVINNQYGMGTSVAQASAEPEIYKRAAAYGMPGERVDGNDVLAVREAADRLLSAARDERRPALFETMTYRHRGHSVADAGKVYRTEQEIAEWKRKDPITRFGALLTEHGLLSSEDIEDIWKQVSAEVKEAIDEALSAAFPDIDGLYEHVYGDPAWREQFSRMRAGAPFGERGEERSWRT